MYMSSLGNRPDLFPQSGYVSKYYENPPADYEVPAALLGSDEKFARLMEEADKYVGFPYVWGGSTPETSFDCSGFVSYVLTNSGLYNTCLLYTSLSLILVVSPVVRFSAIAPSRVIFCVTLSGAFNSLLNVHHLQYAVLQGCSIRG